VDEHGEVYDGSCFLFRVNCVMNGKWGWPDTLHLVDWLDQADKFFFDIAERIYFLTTFVWDVLRRGATEEECREYARSIGAPKRASVQVHNENEEWRPVSPDLAQEDVARAARTLIWFIGGIGFNIPETFLGWGEGTTYAAAKELAAPVRKALQSRQSIIESLCEELCRFQIDQAIIAKQLPPDVDKSVSFNFPSLDVRDVVGAAATFQTLAQAVMVGMGAGLFGRELGLKVLAVAAQELGLELDVAGELEKGTEGAAQVREVLRLLHEAGGVPLGKPLAPKEALAQWEISEEDLERARREFDELMRLSQASQVAGGA